MPRSISPARFDFLEGRQLFAAVNFAIDSDLSYLTIDAKVRAHEVGSVNLNSQGDGNDRTNLEGSLKIDITAKGVRFAGGSDIEAIDREGDFDPGNDDAAFAINGKVKKLITLAKLSAAVRDLSLDLTESSRKAITGSKHRFLIRKAEIEVNNGRIDYDLDSKFGDADGSEDLAGLWSDLENGHGRVTGKKGSRIITIPILVTYRRELEDDVDATFTLKGQVVGREESGATAQAAFPGTTTEPKERDKDRVANQLSL